MVNIFFNTHIEDQDTFLNVTQEINLIMVNIFFYQF